VKDMATNLNAQVLQCIDAGMDSIGNTSKNIVYCYLVQKGKLTREGILDDPTSFIEALKNLFGQGAGILERTIVRQLRETFNIKLEVETLTDVLVVIREKRKGTSGESTWIEQPVGPQSGTHQYSKKGFGNRDDRRGLRT